MKLRPLSVLSHRLDSYLSILRADQGEFEPSRLLPLEMCIPVAACGLYFGAYSEKMNLATDKN